MQKKPGVLVGHIYLSVGRANQPPPVMGFGDDWRPDLLTVEQITEIIATAPDDLRERLRDQITNDTVVFHVFKTQVHDERFETNFFDCVCAHDPKPMGTET